MADWSLPTVTSTYTNLVAEAKARDTDAAVGLDPAATTVTNPVTNMIRWTSASNKWQKYNGATWVDLTATYNIDVAYFGGQLPSYYAALASPAFIGNPTAPTQAVDNNTTRLATTEFVLAQRGIATPVVNGTGAAGTSYRYSSQDHVHPTDTSRAPLASPTFTGTATTPALNVTTTFQIGGVTVTSSAAELNYNDITTLGTAQASKVLTLDASSNLNGTVNSATITTLNARAATPRRVLIESKSVSGATADFTTGIDNTYSVYEFEFIHVLPATDNTNLWCRFSIDGGSSYIATTSYNWAMSKTANSAAAPNGQLADAAIVLSLFNNNSATYDGTSGSMKLFNPSDANKKSIIGSFNHTHATTAYWTIENVSGEIGSTTSAVNAVRFMFSSGNITSGIINLYGIS